MTLTHTRITRADTAGTRLADARAVVRGIADSLAHPIPTEGDYGPRSQRWWAQSIAHGAAGVAILHASLDRTPEQAVTARATSSSTGGWARPWPRRCPPRPERAHGSERRRSVSRSPMPHPTAPTAGPAPRSTRRWTTSRENASTRPTGESTHTADRNCESSTSSMELAGIGGYLLQRDPGHPLVTRVLEYMVALTEPVPADDDAGTTVPGWWSTDPPSGDPTVRGGHSDQGAAHGIAGPLSLLALAGQAGVWVAGQRQAMQRIVSWYDELTRITSSTDDRCRWWPQRLTWPEHRGGASVQTGPGRPSWCYSTPGIARALQLAAIALGDPDGQRRAEQALLAAVTDPAQLGQLSDVSLCHGWAGTALSTWCAAQDSTDTDLAASLHEAVTVLTDSLTDAARPLSARPRATDPIGLIQGAAGAALALHSLTANQVDGWARCLLLR